MERDATGRALAETVDVLVTDGAVAGVEAHGVETCAHGEGRKREVEGGDNFRVSICLLYTSPSPRDYAASRMPSSA